MGSSMIYSSPKSGDLCVHRTGRWGAVGPSGLWELQQLGERSGQASP